MHFFWRIGTLFPPKQVTSLSQCYLGNVDLHVCHVLRSRPCQPWKGAARACGASADASLAVTSNPNILPGSSGIYQDTMIFVRYLRANRIDVSSLLYSNAQIRRVPRRCKTNSLRVGGMLTKTTKAHRSVGIPSASKY